MDDQQARRRAALAALFDRVATETVERVVAEAARAARFFGLSDEVAQRYGESIHATIPAALEALTAPTETERDQKMNDVVLRVRKVSDDHHIPRIVERGLVSIAFSQAGRLMRERADASPFTAQELDSEFVAFRGEFERKLFDD